MIPLYPNVDVFENEEHETNAKQKEQNTGPHFFAVLRPLLSSSCNEKNATQRKNSYVTFIQNAHKFLSEIDGARNLHSKSTHHGKWNENRKNEDKNIFT